MSPNLPRRDFLLRAGQLGALTLVRPSSLELIERAAFRAPDATQAVNFAFDVTPSELITAIVTEAGVLTPPYTESIAAAFSG